MSDLTIRVGGTAADDGAAFLGAWRRAEAGDTGSERVVSFQSWDTLAALLTGERLRLMRRVRRQEVSSAEVLAADLGRPLSEVERDIRALVQADLMEDDGTALRVPAGRIGTVIELA